MKSLETWNAERWAEEHEKGLHDDDCEQRERFALCHCSKRRREAAGQTELPRIYFPAPRCDGCGHDVEFDADAFTCTTCHVTWPTTGTGDGDRASYFTDDYGSGPLGGEKYGKRLIEEIEELEGEGP